ncbi:MAG: S8 family serine peptidase [Gammaproteobacteria bacterium]|nr:S8 family serine peptidase [Gammaproteobacteria bacterium]
MPVRVGIIDSGLPAGTCRGLVAAADFSAGSEDGSVVDLLGHGAAVTAQIAGPEVEICAARVFNRRLSCTPAEVAGAIDWLLEQDVRIINMSFGLRDDRSPLRHACERAMAQGVCLVAASPAQGAAVYPANTVGVVRATGDARCSPGEISWLASRQADFGGYPGQQNHGPAGASIGCASVTAALAALAAQISHRSPALLCQELKATAIFQGPEQRFAPGTGAEVRIQ